MKDLLKIMLIPIVGCIAIGVMFLMVIFGGHWFEEVTVEEEGFAGKATLALPETKDAVITYTGECDGSTYRPVCGFNGETYDNACFAVKAGTTVSHLGACGTRTETESSSENR